MNDIQNKIISKFIMESDKLFHDELKNDENNDYKRNYYAGRLYAAICLKNALKDSQGLGVLSIDFTE